MRRSLVFIAVAVAAFAASVGLSSAGVPATIEVTPNPVEAGADVTITNTPGDASTCESGADAATEGNPEAVTVTIAEMPAATVVFDGSASTDIDGNWQLVTQIAEAGEYQVLAVCNTNGGGGGGAIAPDPERLGPFTYVPADLTVIEQDEPEPEPPTGGPLVPVPPVDLQPQFTG